MNMGSSRQSLLDWDGAGADFIEFFLNYTSTVLHEDTITSIQP